MSAKKTAAPRLRNSATNQRRIAAPATEEAAGCRTLQRGLDLLDALCLAGWDGLRVADMCRALGLQRAPVYRLLQTLLASGYVQRKDRYHYTVTSKVAMPTVHAQGHAIAQKLQPVLERISERLGDAAFAVVREAHISHCVARQLGSHPVQVLPIRIGNRQPLGVGAAGLALLAALPDAEVQQLVAQSTAQLEQYGGMSAERLHLLVRTTRERGWSIVANHATKGVLGVGLAVLSKRNIPVAAVSVASTLERMPKDRQKLVAHTIREVLQAHFPKGV